MDEEKAYWQVFCQTRGMSPEDFERRWPVVSVTYELALRNPTAPLEKVLGHYLQITSESGFCEASRRRAFGRIWARILTRLNGEIPG